MLSGIVGGGNQDYFGYQLENGQLVLTDNMMRAGGVDEVWLEKSGSSKMNLEEIISGDYSSINGTWRNSRGDLLVFDNGNCSSNAWSWSGNLIVGGSVPKMFYDNIAWASGNPAPQPDGIGFMFAPAGISPQNIGGVDKTDTSKDRIVVANNGGQTNFAVSDCAYYKIK